MKAINLPDHGYTPANYAKLVDLTKLSNVAFCEQFNIPKGTFEKHKAGTRTMKWQDWQALLINVKQFIRENVMSNYISCVGGSRVNNFSFDIHENKDGSASIRPNKLGHDLPTTTWLTYQSVDEALMYIESVCGDLEGAARTLYFWNNSDIAEKMQDKDGKEEDGLMIRKLERMTKAEQEHFILQRDYDEGQKFIEDNNYFM